MNVLSLFSGIGGLDLGLERAGMTIAGQVEIDPWCRRVLAKHWPEVPRHDDVRTAAEWWQALGDTEGSRCGRDDGLRAQGSDARAKGLRTEGSPCPGRPRVDLVCGGFPCQPVSLAGKGLAQADSRWLWPAFAGVIRHLRPNWVLVENVPGLLGRGMGDVLGDLAALGYDAEWDCVPAAFVGAPHIRNRVWIVAYPQRRQLRQQPGRRDGQGRPGAPFAGDNGAAWPLAYPANSNGLDVPRVWGALERRPGRRIAGHGGVAARDVADAEGLSGELRTATGERPGGSTGGGLERRNHWAAEPGVGRVAHGIPARVDRLRGLGNAVVPQVAEHVGRLIMKAAA